jgi:hypothetical protein
MGNRYKDFDKHDVGRMLHTLRKSPSESEVEAIRERLADYDPVELLTVGAEWAALRHGDGNAAELQRAEAKARNYRAQVTRWFSPQGKSQQVWIDRAKLPVVRCAHCKKNFYATRADATTCSARCRTALHRSRKHV